MVVRNWMLVGTVGAALTGAACTQILGAHEVVEGMGGSPATSGTGANTGASAGTGVNTGASTGTGATTTSGTGGSAPMACTNGNVVGTWLQHTYEDTIVTFKSDGTYTYGEYVLPALDQEQGEIGTYAITGSVLTLTPTKWTCPCTDYAHTFDCTVLGKALLIDYHGQTSPPYNSDTMPAPSATTGCLGGCGGSSTFKPYPFM